MGAKTRVSAKRRQAAAQGLDALGVDAVVVGDEDDGLLGFHIIKL